jgi:hypothetical protein
VRQTTIFFWDHAEHYQYQTDGSELGEYAKDHSQVPCDLSPAQKNREVFAHFNGLASRLRILEVFPSTRYEHDPNHGAQKKKRDMSETSQLGERSCADYTTAVNRGIKSKSSYLVIRHSLKASLTNEDAG